MNLRKMNRNTRQLWTEEYGHIYGDKESENVEWKCQLDNVSRFCPSNIPHRLEDDDPEDEKTPVGTANDIQP